MGKILVHEFVSLDGVMETPTWTFDFPFDPKMGQAIGAIVAGSKAILLGRTTYQEFAPAWSARTAQDDPGAPFFNESPKYVVSSSLQSADWHNTTILGPYDPDSIRSLKDRIDGDLYVSGSGTLVRALLADGLLDELHMFVFPIVLGSGLRLFEDGAAQSRLALTASESYDSGVVHLGYRLG
ncbi:MAG TPA: dihydrofolate reductase family protein [Solirubrobacteraceae bacterium]